MYICCGFLLGMEYGYRIWSMGYIGCGGIGDMCVNCSLCVCNVIYYHFLQVAILNANYMAARLQDHYKVLFRGTRGVYMSLCVIECHIYM